eukprot:1003538-Prorocentrum_minimum.AAC.1
MPPLTPQVNSVPLPPPQPPPLVYDYWDVRHPSQVNQRGLMDHPDTVADGHPFHDRHKQAPVVVQWVAGVLLPPGVLPSNGTFGPRGKW